MANKLLSPDEFRYQCTFAGLKEFLEEISMDQYSDIMKAKGLALDDMSDMKPADLEAMGIEAAHAAEIIQRLPRGRSSRRSSRSGSLSGRSLSPASRHRSPSPAARSRSSSNMPTRAATSPPTEQSKSAANVTRASTERATKANEGPKPTPEAEAQAEPQPERASKDNSEPAEAQAKPVANDKNVTQSAPPVKVSEEKEPQPQPRGNEKPQAETSKDAKDPAKEAGGTLVVELVGARHLPQTDVLGTIDPYVKFVVPGVKKSQQKSKTVKKSYSPRWNERFEFVIPTSNHTLQLSLYDWDRFSTNDPIGHVSLTIDDFRRAPGKEQEFELKLAKGIEKKAHASFVPEVFLRMWFEEDDPKNAPASRPLPPPSPPQEERDVAHPGDFSGTLIVELVGARNLPQLDTFGVSDPYVRFEVPGVRKSVRKSKYVQNSASPKWDETFQFSIPTANHKLELVVFDHDHLSRNDEIGYVVLLMEDFLRAPGKEQDFELKLAKGVEKRSGHFKPEVTVKMWFEDDKLLRKGERIVKEPIAAEPPRASNGESTMVQRNKVFGTLFLELVSARRLPVMDTVGSIDPYVRLQIPGDKKSRANSKAIKNSASPQWNEGFVFVIPNRKDTLELSMYDWDRFSKNDLIGSVVLSLEDFRRSPNEEQDFALQLSKTAAERATGPFKPKVTLKMRFEEAGAEDAPSKTPQAEPEPKPEESAPSERKESVADLPPPPPQESAPVMNGIGRLYVHMTGAWHLPQVNKFGSIDPYVTLEVAGDKSTLRKTETVKKSRSPKWNQLFIFTLPEAGRKLELTLFDHENFGKDDAIGGVTLSLDDFKRAPNEEQGFDLNLAKDIEKRVNGPYKPKLTMKLRFEEPGLKVVVQEKSRTLKGGSGRVYVDLLGAHHLPRMDRRGVIDPYVVLQMSGDRSTQRKSIIVENSPNPKWEQLFIFGLPSGDHEVELQVYDWDRSSEDDLVGTLALSLADFQRAPNEEQEFALKLTKAAEKRKRGDNKPTLKLRLRHEERGLKVHVTQAPRAKKEANVLVQLGDDVSENVTRDDILGVLHLDLVGARHLPEMDGLGPECIDPYVMFEVSGDRATQRMSRTIEKSFSPKWNQSFKFPIPTAEDTLELALLDFDRVTLDDLVGTVTLSVDDFRRAPGKEQDFALNVTKEVQRKMKGTSKPKVTVVMRFEETKAADKAQQKAPSKPPTTAAEDQSQAPAPERQPSEKKTPPSEIPPPEAEKKAIDEEPATEVKPPGGAKDPGAAPSSGGKSVDAPPPTGGNSADAPATGDNSADAPATGDKPIIVGGKPIYSGAAKSTNVPRADGKSPMIFDGKPIQTSPAGDAEPVGDIQQDPFARVSKMADGRGKGVGIDAKRATVSGVTAIPAKSIPVVVPAPVEENDPDADAKRGGDPRRSCDPRDDDPRRSRDPRDDDPCRSRDPRDDDPRRARDPRDDDPRSSRDPRDDDPRRSHDPRDEDPRRSRDPRDDDPRRSRDARENAQRSEYPRSSRDELDDDPRRSRSAEKEDPRYAEPRRSRESPEDDPRASRDAVKEDPRAADRRRSSRSGTDSRKEDPRIRDSRHSQDSDIADPRRSRDPIDEDPRRSRDPIEDPRGSRDPVDDDRHRSRDPANDDRRRSRDPIDDDPRRSRGTGRDTPPRSQSPESLRGRPRTGVPLATVPPTSNPRRPSTGGDYVRTPNDDKDNEYPRGSYYADSPRRSESPEPRDQNTGSTYGRKHYDTLRRGPSERRRSRSPNPFRADSPERRRSRSSIPHRGESPERRRSRSPNPYRAESPDRRRSRSPNPVRSRYGEHRRSDSPERRRPSIDNGYPSRSLGARRPSTDNTYGSRRDLGTGRNNSRRPSTDNTYGSRRDLDTGRDGSRRPSNGSAYGSVPRSPRTGRSGRQRYGGGGYGAGAYGKGSDSEEETQRSVKSGRGQARRQDSPPSSKKSSTDAPAGERNYFNFKRTPVPSRSSSPNPPKSRSPSPPAQRRSRSPYVATRRAESPVRRSRSPYGGEPSRSSSTVRRGRSPYGERRRSPSPEPRRNSRRPSTGGSASGGGGSAYDGSQSQSAKEDDLLEYLEKIGMEEHFDALKSNGFNTLQVLKFCSIEDLKKIGLKFGHAMYIVRALKGEA